MRLGEACACAVVATSLAALAPAARADTPPAPPTAPAPASAKAPATAAAAPPDDDEHKPPRPPLPPLPARKPLVWEQHIEVGVGVAFAEDLSTTAADGSPTPVRLEPGVGFHVRLGWELFKYLSFTGYMVEIDHALVLPSGSLGVAGTYADASAHTYFFGARVSPTLPIGDRVRLWATAGGGWGLVAYPALEVTPPGGAALTIRARTADVVEIPVGLGASFEIIPRWLRVHAELTYSFYPSQLGDATGTGQTVNDAGKIQNIGPMPHLDGAFTQTLGLSLLL
jgi:hypothetical protein